jgi:ATP-dependent DNA ligase
VFDLLHAHGGALLDVPYADRRARLEHLGLDAQCTRRCGGEGEDAAFRGASIEKAWRPSSH